MKRFELVLILCFVTGYWSLAYGNSSKNIPLTMISYDCWNDASGSSTVDPIDPNLVRADLVDNTLVIQENYPNDALLIVKTDKGEVVFAGRFDRTISITLYDAAKYILFLYLADFSLVGSFQYPVTGGWKYIQRGQIFVINDNSVYTSSGYKIR
ncbi:MAG: hypothetical protein J5761_03600 [Paludibacteraceae bacterium]|nr:hypothetical protein [Paludibacteraceae bacterium]